MARLNIPCSQQISCPGPRGLEDDFPVQNWSSEQPDRKLFIGQNWGWGDEDPALGDNWTHAWCYGVCHSTVSQEDADLCAAAHQYLCIKEPPGDPTNGDGGGGDPTYPVIPQIPPPPPGSETEHPVFYNSAHTCSVTCPDGTSQSYTVPAGTFVSNSQIKADEMAASECIKQLNQKIICIGNLFDWACLGAFGTEGTLDLTSAPFPPYHFTVSGGSVPPGLVLSDEGPATALLLGTPTEAGTFTFTITATGSAGDTQSKEFTIDIFGIDNLTSIPAAKCDTAYSYQLTTKGGHGAVAFELAPGYALPTGLSMSSAGLITGTPTGLPESTLLKVTITDSSIADDGTSEPRVCTTDEFPFTVNGPKFTNAPDGGTQCTQYHAPGGLQITALPAGCTFSGSCPAGLSISATGLITGTPVTPGAATFVLTAVDPSGNVNTQTTNVNIASAGLAYATAIKDMVWVNEETIIGTATFTAYHVGGDVIYELNFPNGDNSHVTNGVSYPQSLVGRCVVPPYPVTMTGVLTVSAPGGTLLDFNVVFTPDFCWTIAPGPLVSSSASHTVNNWNHLGAIVYVSFHIANNAVAGLHVRLEVHFTPLTPP